MTARIPKLTACALTAFFLALGCSHLNQTSKTQDPAPQHVGRLSANVIVTPVNQLLTPLGIQVELAGMRPQALALSPNGRLLVTSGKTNQLVVVSPTSGKILQRIPFPSKDLRTPADAVSSHILAPDKEAQLSFTGLLFSPDGRRLYLSDVKGTIKVFSINNKHKVSPAFSIALPETDIAKHKTDIPAGLAISPDGKRLYVALNLSNRLAEFDPLTGSLIRTWPVGVAPYDVVLAGDKAYVSNWGGRTAGQGDLTGPAGHGTRVRVDPVRHIASEGSVSVISLSSSATPHATNSSSTTYNEILAGLHSSAMALSPNGRWLIVANAASDTLSVIDTRTDQIVETIFTRPSPADLFGASPNALAFAPSGNTLFVCNGTHNALGIIDFQPGESKLIGLLPVGWFPGAVVYDARRRSLYVANIKGIENKKSKDKVSGGMGFNSHQYHGSLSLLKVPAPKELPTLTSKVLRNMRYPLLAQANLPPRPGQPARPVPERVGEPSVFQHVVYIIKENRTYDQVLGDMRQGNGDPSLCIFGEFITPNHHKLAQEFVLLDNTYCSGILSADGHQWTDTAFATDYMERSFAGFPRSYPDGMEDSDVDALAYSPAGFIWDNAIAHGKTLRDYGEFAITEKSFKDPARKMKPKFLDHYKEFVEKTDAIHLYSRPGIETLKPYLVTNTVGWDMDVPDVFRASRFIEDLKGFERSNTFPNLTLLCLPNDHTSGTKVGSPTPAAHMADNDLALGQIVEAISRSRFWTNTCIFVIEDDPQNGWDHVSGYRTVAYVISPYTKRGEVISTLYNQTSLLRTIELILGLPPMNQMDASATLMSNCFNDKAKPAPYCTLTNNVPLDQMNPAPVKISDPLLRKQAYASARLPLDRPDQCPEDLLNRILWHAMKGSSAPYPAWAVRAVKDDH